MTDATMDKTPSPREKKNLGQAGMLEHNTDWNPQVSKAEFGGGDSHFLKGAERPSHELFLRVETLYSYIP